VTLFAACYARDLAQGSRKLGGGGVIQVALVEGVEDGVGALVVDRDRRVGAADEDVFDPVRHVAGAFDAVWAERAGCGSTEGFGERGRRFFGDRVRPVFEGEDDFHRGDATS
jgi:hypothetical protein